MRIPLPSWLAPGLCALAALVIPAGTAFADDDDQPFITLHTTELEEPGDAELENWLGWNSGHSHEAFNAYSLRNELEYGVADNLQGSLYLSYNWSDTRPHAPRGTLETENNLSVATEIVWRALDVDTAPLGLAFYVEPEIGTGERSVEAKILLQKNFVGDALRAVVNVIAQDAWEHDPAGTWEEASSLEFDAGLAWRLSPAWNVALEFDNERGYDGEILGADARPQSSSFYLGPTIQYLADPFEITLGLQTQLPVAGNPAHLPGNVVDGFTADDEHFRMTLRLTSEL